MRDWLKPPAVNLQRRCRTATFVYFLLLHHRRCFSDGRAIKWYVGDIPHNKQIIALSLFTRRRRVARSANPARGHCNRTRYVARQVYCRIRLYSQIAIHGGVAMRKSAKHSLFINNFQTANVVYKEVLSWHRSFCMSLSLSLDVWRIFVCVFYINAYVNEYTVACNEWNSAACNTTRRSLFRFLCFN